MKNVMMLFAFLMLSSFAHAAPTHIALCEKQMLAEDVTSPDLHIIQEQNIEEVSALDPFFLNLANVHIRKLEYTDKDLNFEEMKQLFTEGEYRYDDLILLSYQAKSTGTVYHEVGSYPGDNHYGMITDNQGNLVGSINDGDLYILENGKELSCYDLLGL